MEHICSASEEAPEDIINSCCHFKGLNIESALQRKREAALERFIYLLAEFPREFAQFPERERNSWMR